MLAVAAVACAFLAWCALVWLQLRHVALSALVLAVPALTLGYIALAEIVAFPQAYSSAFFFAAAAMALAAGDWIARGVCQGLTRREAYRDALGRLVATMAPVLAVYALAMAVFSYRLLPWRACAASAASLVVAFGIVAVMIRLAAGLPYSEAFIARANAARERRERATERLAFTVERRWALSIAGIAAIVATLTGFAIRDLYPPQPLPGLWPHLCAVPAVALAGCIFVARDGRTGIALALTYTLASALMFAVLLRRDGMPDLDIFLAFDTATVMLAVLSIVASRFRAARREGEDVAPALTLALREEGSLALVVALLWIVPGALVTIRLGIVSPLLALGVVTACGTLLLFPALTVAIHTLLPRYRSVDEVFGK